VPAGALGALPWVVLSLALAGVFAGALPPLILGRARREYLAPGDWGSVGSRSFRLSTKTGFSRALILVPLFDAGAGGATTTIARRPDLLRCAWFFTRIRWMELIWDDGAPDTFLFGVLLNDSICEAAASGSVTASTSPGTSLGSGGYSIERNAAWRRGKLQPAGRLERRHCDAADGVRDLRDFGFRGPAHAPRSGRGAGSEAGPEAQRLRAAHPSTRRP